MSEDFLQTIFIVIPAFLATAAFIALNRAQHRRFVRLLEKLETGGEAQFAAFDKRFEEHFREIDGRFAGINDRFDELETKIDDRFDDTDCHFAALAKRFVRYAADRKRIARKIEILTPGVPAVKRENHR